MQDKLKGLTTLRMAYFREVYPPDTDFKTLEELTMAGFEQGRAKVTCVERDGKPVSMCLMSLMDKMPNARIPDPWCVLDTRKSLLLGRYAPDSSQDGQVCTDLSRQ